MSLLDSIAKRLGYVPKPKSRNFKAANANRIFADWVQTTESADAVLKYDLATMRNRARELERNNDYVRKYLGLLENNVLGSTGVVLEMRSKDRNGQLDRQANDILESAWQNWGRPLNCTVTRRQTWLDVQRLALRSAARDGSCLIIKVRGFDNSYGFALQVLEADHLDTDYHVSRLESGNEIRFGIEFNNNREPVAYHLLERHEGDDIAIGKPQRRRRIEAADVIHVFKPDRAEQTTGVPWIASSMSGLHTLQGYFDAELVAARVAASKMGFYKTERGDELTGYEDDHGNNLLMDVEPGAFEMLPPGVSVEQFSPTHPTTQFADFVKSNLRSIASGLGISYNSLAGDLESVNYSSLRQAALEEREEWSKLQQWFIDGVCLPVFESWLEEVLLNGSIGLPAARLGKFNAPHFRPRRWGWVDPQKDLAAQVMALENGLKSRRQIIRDSGGSIEEVVQNMVADKQLFDANGLAKQKSRPTKGGSEE